MNGWNYAEAGRSSHGTMICCACNKLIERGLYRYRQKSKAGDWYYQTQHEACCIDDPEWQRIIDRRRESAEHQAEFVKACIEFKSKWDIDELDQYIPEQAP